MASCVACGADITWAQDASGVKVPLEKFTEISGDRRYRITDLGPPLVVEPVVPSYNLGAYPDHRVDCPAAGNGF